MNVSSGNTSPVNHVHVNSYTEFEFNANMFTIDPLITECNRGDACAMSDALNQMYLTMVMGQHKFEAYMSYNEERFQSLSSKVDSYAVEVDRVKSLTKEQGSAITNLKSSKVDQSQFTTLQSEMKALKASNRELRSELEELKSDQAEYLQVQDRCIDNNNLDIKRVPKK